MDARRVGNRTTLVNCKKQYDKNTTGTKLRITRARAQRCDWLNLAVHCRAASRARKDSTGQSQRQRFPGCVYRGGCSENVGTTKRWLARLARRCPFASDRARSTLHGPGHQRAWADYLKCPSNTRTPWHEVPYHPAGENHDGSTPEVIEETIVSAGADKSWKGLIRSEGPQHKVMLTQRSISGSRSDAGAV